MSATLSALSVMRTLHFVKRRLRLGCWALSVWLLCAVSVSAQEIFSLPSEDRRLNPEFEVVYRVGSLSGEDWEQFGRVRKVAFNDAGQLYIFDTQADRITARSGAVGFTEIMPDPEGGAVFTVVEAEAAAYTLPGSDSEPTPLRASSRTSCSLTKCRSFAASRPAGTERSGYSGTEMSPAMTLARSMSSRWTAGMSAPTRQGPSRCRPPSDRGA